MERQGRDLPGLALRAWIVDPESDTIRAGPARTLNPDVANVFFRSGMIEAWGRGIERIKEACREAGTPEPELRCETSGLWVVFDTTRRVG